MIAAMSDVVNNVLSLRKAADKYNVKKSTLKDYVDKARKGTDFKLGAFNSRQVFPMHMEEELTTYLLTCSAMYYGLTPKSLRRLAFEYARKNNIVTPATWNANKMAGKDWLTGFLRRNTSLSIRSPEATSLARMTSFNHTNLNIFQDKLADVIDRYSFTASEIYNLDETGCTTVHNVPKVIARKGAHQVGQATSRERGELVTMVGIICANGNALPPALVFPRVRYDASRMMLGAPAGALGLVHPSGWMTSENFVVVLKHFATTTRCSKEKKVLLIMDNHDSHLSVDGLNFAKDNGIVILTLPPHTSNKLQPLDRTVYGPFKTFYKQAADSWMLQHPGQTLSIYDLTPLVATAWDRAATPANVKSGFKCTGICPYDRGTFSDDDFMAAFVTDRPDPNLRPSTSVDQTQAPTDVLPRTSDGATSLSVDPLEITQCDSLQYPVSPHDIAPYPKAPARKKQSHRGRKRGRCIVATDTPEKNAIEEMRNKKLKKKDLFQKKKDDEKNDSSSDNNEDVQTDIIDDESEYSDEEGVLPLDMHIDRDPEIDEFVLVQFDKKVHYIGQITGNKDEDNDLEISYLRKSTKVFESFIFPNIEDLASVNINQIKAILPKPLAVANKRLRGYFKFGISFSGLTIR